MRSGVSSKSVSIAAALLLIATGPAGAAARALQEPRVPALLLLWLPIVLACFTALELVLWVLAPAPLSTTCRAIARGRARCLPTGVVAALVGGALSAFLGKLGGVGGPLAALLLGMITLAALTGVTAVTALLGQGVLELAGRGSNRAMSVALGTVILVLTVLVPFVGWALGIYFLLIGLGGALHALARLGVE
jgi:hypothetical protein